MFRKKPYATKICLNCSKEFPVFSRDEVDIVPLCKRCSTPPFICRVCGHNDYEAIRPSSLHTQFGSSISPLFYTCKKCTSIFKDPKKFSKV